MFSGIVERTAKVSEALERDGGRLIKLLIDERPGSPPWRPAAPGESIAVNGVCLTVVESSRGHRGTEIGFDVVPETLRLTTLGALARGDDVNIERSLRAGDLLGSHYVTGHVDGVGRVRARRAEGNGELFEIEAPPALLRRFLRKGSVAVDGVGLTIVGLERAAGWFSFAAIPHTLERTALGHRLIGSRVNLETDALGKWVLHAVAELLHDEPDRGALRELAADAGAPSGPGGDERA
jgi:riboflavin synthase